MRGMAIPANSGTGTNSNPGAHSSNAAHDVWAETSTWWIIQSIMLVVCFSLVTFSMQLKLCCDHKDFSPKQYSSQKAKFLTVFLMMSAGDWLQGPYVYALYEYCSYAIAEIGYLFIVGFGASALFGPPMGVLADRWGRKKFVLLYGFIYTLSCITKHSCNFGILLVGRILGGISTSLLFSVFETWLVCDHNQHGLPDELLGETFSQAFFLNSLVAILCGIVGNTVYQATDAIYAPFDVAGGCLVIGSILCAMLWKENHGDRDADWKAHWKLAGSSVLADPMIWRVGVIQSFFEGAMYIFVFMWTPVLEDALGGTAHSILGQVFACFMTSCMMGSASFSLALKFGFHPKSITVVNLFVATSSMLMVVFQTGPGSSVVAFLLFEFTIGVYFPSIAVIKSEVVPEESRAAFYNAFRIPLNLIVVATLVLVEKMSSQIVFVICASLVGLCFLLSLTLKFPSQDKQGYKIVPNKSKQ